jgi:hypothetical protein
LPVTDTLNPPPDAYFNKQSGAKHSIPMITSTGQVIVILSPRTRLPTQGQLDILQQLRDRCKSKHYGRKKNAHKHRQQPATWLEYGHPRE